MVPPPNTSPAAAGVSTAALAESIAPAIRTLAESIAAVAVSAAVAAVASTPARGLEALERTNNEPATWGDDFHASRRQAADWYRVHGVQGRSYSTLEKLAITGGGPRITFIGGKPHYRIADLKEDVRGRTITATSTTERDAKVRAAAKAAQTS